MLPVSSPCKPCEGTGLKGDDICALCAGQGEVCLAGTSKTVAPVVVISSFADAKSSSGLAALGAELGNRVKVILRGEHDPDVVWVASDFHPVYKLGSICLTSPSFTRAVGKGVDICSDGLPNFLTKVDKVDVDVSAKK